MRPNRRPGGKRSLEKALLRESIPAAGVVEGMEEVTLSKKRRGRPKKAEVEKVSVEKELGKRTSFDFFPRFF